MVKNNNNMVAETYYGSGEIRVVAVIMLDIDFSQYVLLLSMTTRIL